MRQRLLVGAVVILLASQASGPAWSLDSAPVTGVLIQRTVSAVITVHPDGRAPEVSEPAGFERRLQPFVATDDAEDGYLLGSRWLDAATPARGEDGYLFSGSADAGAAGWVEQEPTGWLDGWSLGPFESDFDDYSLNAAAGWWKHPCVDDGPVCGPTDGSTVFQGSLAGALWEFSDDTTVERRFRVVLFLAEVCTTPNACQ